MSTVYVCDICHETISPTSEPVERVDVTVNRLNVPNEDGPGPMAGPSRTDSANYHPECFEDSVESALKNSKPTT